MEIKCKPILGIVDGNWGVEPFYEDMPVLLKTRLILTTKRWRFLRFPVIRRVIRLGLFVDPLPDRYEVVHSPRIVVQADSDVEAQTIRFRHFKYRCSFNVMGGVFAAIQPYYGDMVIFDTFGVFVGILEWQYKMQKPTHLNVKVTMQSGGEAGGYGEFYFGIT